MGTGEYFLVLLPDGSRFAHAVASAQRHPIGFGRELAAKLAGVPHRADWKACKVRICGFDRVVNVSSMQLPHIFCKLPPSPSLFARPLRGCLKLAVSTQPAGVTDSPEVRGQLPPGAVLHLLHTGKECQLMQVGEADEKAMTEAFKATFKSYDIMG